MNLSNNAVWRVGHVLTKTPLTAFDLYAQFFSDSLILPLVKVAYYKPIR